MVRAETTKEQAEIAKREGLALYAFACRFGGTFQCSGPIPHQLAKPLIRLMTLVTADRICHKRLEAFVESCKLSKE